MKRYTEKRGAQVIEEWPKRLPLNKVDKLLIVVMAVFLIVPLIRIAMIYGSLPDIIPTHFGVSGEVDGYGGKWTLWMLWGVSLLCCALMVVSELFPSLDQCAGVSAQAAGGRNHPRQPPNDQCHGRAHSRILLVHRRSDDCHCRRFGCGNERCSDHRFCSSVDFSNIDLFSLALARLSAYNESREEARRCRKAIRKTESRSCCVFPRNCMMHWLIGRMMNFARSMGRLNFY